MEPCPYRLTVELVDAIAPPLNIRKLVRENGGSWHCAIHEKAHEQTEHAGGSPWRDSEILRAFRRLEEIADGVTGSESVAGVSYNDNYEYEYWGEYQRFSSPVLGWGFGDFENW